MFGALLSAWGLVKDFVGRPFREWARWAEREPEPAAQQLELVARVLRHRALAYKRQGGWRARRDRRIATALLEHALALREAASADELRSVCAVKPGEWQASPRARRDGEG